MRLIHSFCSSACSEEAFKQYMWYFALSCIYAKQNDFVMVLHCDKKTEDILKLAPYDEIITDIPPYAPSTENMYAQAKFIAMKHELLGSIHIDGDVFLKGKELPELLKFDDYDCIVQNVEYPENGWGYLWEESSEMFRFCPYPDWAKRKCESMYNCGIVGFNNQELKNIYFDTYWKMVNRYANNPIAVNGVPDIIIEQQFLKDLTDSKNYSVKTLLDFYHLEKAKEIGFQHSIGGSKDKNLDKVKSLIKEYDENLYNELVDIIETNNIN